MQKIVTLTLNPTIDQSTAVDTVASEIKLRCEQPAYDPGGGGINVSRAIKKLGGESIAIFTKGGTTGQLLETLLERENLTMHPIPVQGMTRENFIVFEKTTTLQYRFGFPGAPLTAEELVRCTEAALALQPDYLVASGSLPPDVPVDYYAALTRTARAKGIRVIVDTSGKALEAMKGADPYLLKPNIGELETFSGEKFTGEKQLKIAAQRLIHEEHLCDVMLVSLGAGGAALITADQFVQIRPPVVPIGSKVGAGDSMVGGMVLALAKGHNLIEAAKWGVSAGTAAVMSTGTQLCSRENFDHVYEQVMVQEHA